MKYLLVFMCGLGSLSQLDAKIYDCFTFFHEVDILEIHLAELYPYVDKFIIVECAEGHSGMPHEFVFPQHRERYARFMDKVYYHQVGRKKFPNYWERERYQRNQVILALQACRARPSDVIISGDVDEIIPGKMVPELVKTLKKHRLLDFYKLSTDIT